MLLEPVKFLVTLITDITVKFNYDIIIGSFSAATPFL